MKLELDLPDYEILHPEIQRGLVEMARGACAVLVTAKRGKPDDPALGQTIDEHLTHAKDHAAAAWSCYGTGRLGDVLVFPGSEIDDDGHPHMHHCTARVVLAIARMGRVGK